MTQATALRVQAFTNGDVAAQCMLFVLVVERSTSQKKNHLTLYSSSLFLFFDF